VAELEQVTEQHEAIATRCGVEQRRQPIGAPEDVALGLRPEVQIGDDQRAQSGVPG
jgi:hypothetical protein